MTSGDYVTFICIGLLAVMTIAAAYVAFRREGWDD